MAVVAAFAVAHLGLPFAGEDFYNGLPWHHEEISEDALRAKGYGPDAIEEIGWNADYVDSYLYNPLWWIQGGLSRFKVAMAITPDLTKVHFDDNFSGDHIRRTWRRYLTGAMAGLVWAAERNDIAAGRNLIGVTFHAIQDFYSHSNWIDSPDRRDLTWFEFEKAKRDVLAVYAGAYEHAAQTGVKHHGKIGPSCTLLRQPLVKPFLEPGCTAFSPLHNSRICELYDECKEGNPIQPNLFGLTVPDSVLYASPPGMNLDARWSANIGVRVRGLTDIDGAKAFDTARGLAQKASEQWLEIVDEKLEKMGFGAYLNQLKKANDTTMKEKQYEEYHRFPFQFLSAGTYPPDLRTPEEEWYLRVQARTGTDRGAGTDSDIYLEADGKRFLLDYLPRANPIIGYNDFESGDLGVYTVGPFAKLPEKITLFNNQAGGPEVARAIAQSAIDSVRSLADTVGSALLSLVAGHADRVGTNRHFWTPEQLAAIPAVGRAFTIQVNGGDEGNYRIDGKITKTAESPAGAAEPWYEFRVQLTSLVCIREGSVDRLSPSEEPYILALLVPFPGNILKYKTSPFVNTDTGETKRIGYTFPTVRLPKTHGMLSLPISLWESDSESETSRRQQLDKFADEAARRTGPARQGVLDAVGAAVAADWRLASLSVYAFNRGGHVLKTGTVHETSVNAWLKGRERRVFSLSAARLKAFPAVDARTIDILGAEKEPDPTPRPDPSRPTAPTNLSVGTPLDEKHPLVVKPIRPTAEAWLDFVEKEVKTLIAKAKTDFVGKRKRAAGRQDSDWALMDEAFIDEEFSRVLSSLKYARQEWGRLKPDAQPLEQHWKARAAFGDGASILFSATSAEARLHTKAISSEWYTDTYRVPHAELAAIRSKPDSPERKSAESAYIAMREREEDAAFDRYVAEIRGVAASVAAARLRFIRTMAFFRVLVEIQSFPDQPTYLSGKKQLLEDYKKADDYVVRDALSLSGLDRPIHLYATHSKVRTVRHPDLETQTPRFLSFDRLLGGNLEAEATAADALVREGRFSPFRAEPTGLLALIEQLFAQELGSGYGSAGSIAWIDRNKSRSLSISNRPSTDAATTTMRFPGL